MKKLYLVVWSILSCVLLSCSGSENGKSLPNPPKHIVLVGFDGLSSYSLNNGAEMPQFRSMMQDGCYTLENRSVLPSSSAVNWASTCLLGFSTNMVYSRISTVVSEPNILMQNLVSSMNGMA